MTTKCFRQYNASLHCKLYLACLRSNDLRWCCFCHAGKSWDSEISLEAEETITDCE